MTFKNNKVMHHPYSYFHNVITTLEINQWKDTVNS